MMIDSYLSRLFGASSIRSPSVIATELYQRKDHGTFLLGNARDNPEASMVSTRSFEANLLGITGKSAIVTGAAGGMGSSTTRLLARLGANVLAVDLHFKRNQFRNMMPGKVLNFEADVSDYSQVKKAVSACVRSFSDVDILVNCAGILKGGTILDLDFKDWKRIIDVNLVGYVNFAKEVSTVMIRNKTRGRIVNVSSTAAISAEPGNIAYCASKGGIVSLTKALAIELAPQGIRVNSIAPGWTETPFATAYLTEKSKEAVRKRIPLGYICPPDEMARSIVFLASDMSSFMTGTIMVVDGGQLSDSTIPGVEY
jgi:3-oxoacyl-[acyl-carrier protein] reductase